MLEQYCPFINIAGEASDAAEGFDAVCAQQPDLIFLDIDMPGSTGFDLLRRFPQPLPFAVIFVTAYDHFALPAIKTSAVDYLLKPVDVEQLVFAVNKARRIQKLLQLDQAQQTIPSTSLHPSDRIALPTLEGLALVVRSNIIRLEAEGSYSRVYLSGGEQQLVSRSLGDWEQILPEAFFRVHHSNIIQLHHVVKYIRGRGGYLILSNGDKVDVAARRKDELLRRFELL